MRNHATCLLRVSQRFSQHGTAHWRHPHFQCASIGLYLVRKQICTHHKFIIRPEFHKIFLIFPVTRNGDSVAHSRFFLYRGVNRLGVRISLNGSHVANKVTRQYRTRTFCGPDVNVGNAYVARIFCRSRYPYLKDCNPWVESQWYRIFRLVDTIETTVSPHERIIGIGCAIYGCATLVVLHLFPSGRGLRHGNVSPNLSILGSLHRACRIEAIEVVRVAFSPQQAALVGIHLCHRARLRRIRGIRRHAVVAQCRALGLRTINGNLVAAVRLPCHAVICISCFICGRLVVIYGASYGTLVGRDAKVDFIAHLCRIDRFFQFLFTSGKSCQGHQPRQRIK